MSTPLSTNKIQDALKELNGWAHNDDKLWKEFKFENFRQAVAFIVRVGFEAEDLNHHPNIFNVYNKVTIGLQTHDAGNKVTEKDVELAKKIEALS